jgi:integrase
MGVKIRKLRGKWYLVIDYRGKRKTRMIGTDRKLAEQARRQVEAKLALGDLGTLEDPEQRLTFGDYEEKWERQYVHVRCKRSTAMRYKSVMQIHVLPRFRNTALKDITRDDLKDFFSELAKKELAANSLQNILIAFRVALGCAVEDGLLPANPAAKLGKFIGKDEKRFEAAFLTRAESEQFLAAVLELSPAMHPLFMLYVRTGLRLGEGLALRWADIQFGENEADSNRFIWVRRNFTARALTSPKNSKTRHVDLSRQLRRVLLAIREQRLLDAYLKGRDNIADDLVFPSESDSFLDPSNLHSRYFLPAIQKAGLRRFRIHDLRHTFASLLLQDGASLPYVRDQLGHSSISITVDLYGHLVPSVNIAFVDRLDADPERDTKTTPAQSANETQTPREPKSAALSYLVGKMEALGRVELPTNGLGNRCSIHLSYRAMAT